MNEKESIKLKLTMIFKGIKVERFGTVKAVPVKKKSPSGLNSMVNPEKRLKVEKSLNQTVRKANGKTGPIQKSKSLRQIVEDNKPEPVEYDDKGRRFPKINPDGSIERNTPFPKLPFPNRK